MLARLLLKATGGVAVLGLAGVSAYAVAEPGFRRECYFWGHIAPIYVHYHLTSWRLRKASDASRQVNVSDRSSALPDTASYPSKRDLTRHTLMFLTDMQAAFEQLHELYAPKALDIILQLRGVYVKFGQVCSARPELVPRAYRERSVLRHPTHPSSRSSSSLDRFSNPERCQAHLQWRAASALCNLKCPVSRSGSSAR